MEASHHSTPSVHSLSRCSTIMGIAGGVGITAIRPIIRTFGGTRSQFYWGAKHSDIIQAARSDIRQLEVVGVEIETTIGARIDVAGIVKDEILRSDVRGPVGIVVCGPPEMADAVRRAVGDSVSSAKSAREVVFIDETFSW